MRLGSSSLCDNGWGGVMKSKLPLILVNVESFMTLLHVCIHIKMFVIISNIALVGHRPKPAPVWTADYTYWICLSCTCSSVCTSLNSRVQDLNFVLAEMLHLKQDVYAYSCLNQSGCSYVLTMDDDKQFTVTTVSCSVTYHLLSYSPDFLHWE